MISFDNLRTANLNRFNDFGDKYPYNPNSWGLTEWAVAIAGEAGEMCNLVKKRNRGQDIPAAELGKELADMVIYIDLMAHALGFDLGELVKEKFNEVSGRIGSEVEL